MTEIEKDVALDPYYRELGNAIITQAVKDYIAGSLVRDYSKDIKDIGKSLAMFRAVWNTKDTPLPVRKVQFMEWQRFNDSLKSEARIRTEGKSYREYAEKVLESETLLDALPWAARIRQKLLNKDDSIKEHMAMANWPGEVKEFVNSDLFTLFCGMPISPQNFIKALDKKVEDLKKNGGYVGKAFYSAESNRKRRKPCNKKSRIIRAHWVKRPKCEKHYFRNADSWSLYLQRTRRQWLFSAGDESGCYRANQAERQQSKTFACQTEASESFT